ncbi:glycosyltransferase [Stakelama tenebrarum]|uniref:Glycosyltransferase family 4 protein n=1 Tax=Stakelama tenebrarum TaxID=2711215 RepID=A0A6G6Y3F1_9SPHN|nr:glycosyltransferase [Sphingosinithalassobacter tenebrarum]QIG79337.1 glycosyltransferase family 4 protein [Sphingosinithalassobacter tenebrarum]
MLRILTLSTLFPDASRPNFGVFVEQQTRGIARRDDLDVRVVAPVGLPPWPLTLHPHYRARAHLPRHEQWRGLDVIRPRFLNLPGTGGRFHPRMIAAALASKLERLRAEFPFDLIAAEFFYPDGPAAMRLAERFDVPFSIKARGSDVHYWANNPKTQDMCLAAGRAAGGLLTVSDAMKRDLVTLGLDEARIERSLTGVDQARFHPRDRAAAKAKFGVSGPFVVALGSLTPNKDHSMVIDAVAKLPDVTLWIVGQGFEQPMLEAKIAEHGIGDRVRLTGPVPHADMPELLAAADAMALASRSEGLANAWVESLASGTPIVIPDVGGAREVMREGAGFIVERNADAFAVGIAAVLAEPPETESVVAAARPFTWPANAEHLSDFYHRLVAAHRGQRVSHL